MYKVKVDPFESEEKIKIKMNIESKKPEITWESFSEDLDSTGTDKVKPSKIK